METLLSYESVEICYNKKTIVKDINFSLHSGEILGIVGESGSGKSTILKSITGILGKLAIVTKGNIYFQKKNLLDLSEIEMRKIRGAEIGTIFQDSAASLCPIRTIGAQIYESNNAHEKITKEKSNKQALNLFNKLGFKDGERILKSYSFEMSGGMNQRIGIAMAMMMMPKVLLADEPTSALDVLTQKQVIEEMLFLRKLYGTSIIVVTHDIGVIKAMADSVLVLKDGIVMEYGKVEQVLENPQSQYTKDLLESVPKLRRQ